jgi:hypothetical protein
VTKAFNDILPRQNFQNGIRFRRIVQEEFRPQFSGFLYGGCAFVSMLFGLLPEFPGGTLFSVVMLRCWSRKGERESEAGGLRVDAEGKISNVKAQMTKKKTQMSNALPY